MFKSLALLFTVISIAGLGFVSRTSNNNDAEVKAVERACLDYVEGVYEIKPELIERSVHPELKKYGYWRGQGKTEYRGTAMTYEQLHELSKSYNKDGRVPEDAPKEVTVFDVMDKTASAKLVAQWGIDYFHLVKEEGQWKILQVVWQSPPAK